MTGSAARPYSEAYLLAYSAEHVAYEVDMFFGLAEILSSPTRSISASSADGVRIVNNSLVESFGIHLRNMIDFLYLDNPRPSDVVAADFCISGQWEDLRPAISQILDITRVRANKELAHLSTDRIAGTDPAKGWAFTALANEIRPIIQLFTRNARATALSPNVAKAVR